MRTKKATLERLFQVLHQFCNVPRNHLDRFHSGYLIEFRARVSELVWVLEGKK